MELMHCNEISRNTLSYIVVSQKFKLKLISVKFLLPMISRNELSIHYQILLYGMIMISEELLVWKNFTEVKKIICYVEPSVCLNIFLFINVQILTSLTRFFTQHDTKGIYFTLEYNKINLFVTA